MLWIVGTSVSIEQDGYVPRLTVRAREIGVPLTNLSVGDQTSLTGCMRVLACADQIGAGDIVVWEYSLLDTILAGDNVPPEDVHCARRMAWRCLRSRGAWLLVVMTPPRESLAHRTGHERQIAGEASTLDVLCIDLRELFTRLHADHPETHYRDDRHPRADSPVIDLLVQEILAFVREHHGDVPPVQTQQQPESLLPRWRWLGAADMARGTRLRAKMFRNSLMAVEAITLSVDARLAIPAAARLVGVGVLSTHRSGGLWCGHPGCAPAATRLPTDLAYAFLLRSTPVPCVREQIDCLAAAPTWAYARGVWAGYGQEVCDQPGEVSVFGVLYEPARPPQSVTMGAGDGAVVPHKAHVKAGRRSIRGIAARVWRRLRRGID